MLLCRSIVFVCVIWTCEATHIDCQSLAPAYKTSSFKDCMNTATALEANMARYTESHVCLLWLCHQHSNDSGLDEGPTEAWRRDVRRGDSQDSHSHTVHDEPNTAAAASSADSDTRTVSRGEKHTKATGKKPKRNKKVCKKAKPAKTKKKLTAKGEKNETQRMRLNVPQTLSPLGYDMLQQTCCPVENSRLLRDTYVPWGSEDRALRTTPPEIAIRRSGLSDAGAGAFSRVFLPAHTWLGEYEGDALFVERLVTDGARSYSWQVNHHHVRSHYVNAYSNRTSNWLRFVNCATVPEELNVVMCQCYNKVFYKTLRHVLPGEELLIFYGVGYARDLGIDVARFRGLRSLTETYVPSHPWSRREKRGGV